MVLVVVVCHTFLSSVLSEGYIFVFFVISVSKIPSINTFSRTYLAKVHIKYFKKVYFFLQKIYFGTF